MNIPDDMYLHADAIADMKRLDWLQNEGHLLRRHDMTNENDGARSNRGGPIHWALTIREAIDAAMQAEKGRL